ncbi:restriction endonuclease subunit S [Caldibacillus thermoamylovorans]
MSFRYVKLGSLFDITSGGTPSRKNKAYYENGDIPWVKTGDLKNMYLVDADEYITQQALNESSAKLFPKGTVLIAMYGATIGNCSILSINAATNQACAAFKPNNRIIPEFLYYYLTSIKEKLISLAVGGAQPNISISILRNIEIPLLTINQQERVVSILNKSKELIDKRKAQIEALDQLTQSVFLEMFGDPKLNKKNWKKQKLNDVCLRKGEYGSGSSAIPYDSGKPRYIRITDIRDDGSLNDDIVAPSNPDDYDKYRLNEGDILFARSGATVGKTYLHSEKNGYCIFAGYLIRFVPDVDKINPKFLFHFTRTQYYKQWVMNKQNTVAQPNINAKQYGEELFIICPPLELQNRFAKIIEEIEVEKELLQKSMVELKNNFNSLMQRAFKGELFND